MRQFTLLLLLATPAALAVVANEARALTMTPGIALDGESDPRSLTPFGNQNGDLEGVPDPREAWRAAGDLERQVPGTAFSDTSLVDAIIAGAVDGDAEGTDGPGSKAPPWQRVQYADTSSPVGRVRFLMGLAGLDPRAGAGIIATTGGDIDVGVGEGSAAGGLAGREGIDLIAVLVSALILPNYDVDGLVTFSVGGLGRFTLWMSDEQRIRIVDLDTDTAITVSPPRQRDAGTEQALPTPNVPRIDITPLNTTRSLEQLMFEVLSLLTQPLVLLIVLAAGATWALVAMVNGGGRRSRGRRA